MKDTCSPSWYPSSGDCSSGERVNSRNGLENRRALSSFTFVLRHRQASKPSQKAQDWRMQNHASNLLREERLPRGMFFCILTLFIPLADTFCTPPVAPILVRSWSSSPAGLSSLQWPAHTAHVTHSTFLRTAKLRLEVRCNGEFGTTGEKKDELVRKAERKRERRWVSLPHVGRRDAIRAAAAAATLRNSSPREVHASEGGKKGWDGKEGLGGESGFRGKESGRVAGKSGVVARSVDSIDKWGAIPVWPAWPTPASPGGGRVRPVALPVEESDPFLLLAHHRHTFSPGDPLRAPFKAVGGALGLPYVGDEGFVLHPHRGIDIWTMVLDGSDGFRHRDSMGGQALYRGGSTQFMRTGAGALHEEMWETRGDRTTSIELLQLWVNLPAALKMSPPAIRYLGPEWGAPYGDEEFVDPTSGARTQVQVVSDALPRGQSGEGAAELPPRPEVQIRLAHLPPRGSWVCEAAGAQTAVAYVLRGVVRVNGVEGPEVQAGSTCRFRADGTAVWLVNARSSSAQVLLLGGMKLKEPVALGGPIVMNSKEELSAAYAQLQAGTFLDQSRQRVSEK